MDFDEDDQQEEQDRGPERLRWYHWAALSACSAAMFMLGLLELWQGADPVSRFYTIDTVVVHVLGAALALCALWLPLRHDRAFVASIWVLGLTALENLATYRFEANTLADNLMVIVTLVIFLGGPALLLSELRPIFRADAEKDEPV